jgi:protein-tyrosine phosphatase
MPPAKSSPLWTQYTDRARAVGHYPLRRRATATIDLHCHLLPGLDDGARDLEDAIAMARQAQADGIAAICATPHIRADHAVCVADLPGKRAQLAAALARAGCPVAVLAGGEVAADIVNDLDDARLAAVTLGAGGRWILLEPSPGPLDARLATAVDALRARGFGALIAHPERHLAPDLVDQLRRVIAEGALVQATAAYFVDEPTRPAMLDLARAGVIHVLGSDSHSSRAGRPVALAAGLEVLSAVEPTAAHLDWVAHGAPEAITRGAEVEPPY